jgi:hypothetical protein
MDYCVAEPSHDLASFNSLPIMSLGILKRMKTDAHWLPVRGNDCS